MKASRCIALVAIAALAACSEQSHNEVTGVRQSDFHYVPDPGVDPDFARLYTNISGTTSCSATDVTMAAFAVRGSAEFDPTGKGTQFSIIAPELNRRLPLNHGMMTSYIARNGANAVYQALGNVQSAVMTSSYGGSGMDLKSINAVIGDFSHVVAADLNGDAFMDAIVLVPVTSLQAVGGIIGPERDIFIEGRAPAKGGQTFNPKGPVSVGGTAPCVPPPPPPPIYDRTFTH